VRTTWIIGGLASLARGRRERLPGHSVFSCQCLAIPLGPVNLRKRTFTGEKFGYRKRIGRGTRHEPGADGIGPAAPASAQISGTGASQPEHKSADRGQRVAVDHAQIDGSARTALGAEDTGERRRADCRRPQRIVAGRHPPIPVVNHGLSLGARGPSAFNFTVPAFMSRSRVRTPMRHHLVVDVHDIVALPRGSEETVVESMVMVRASGHIPPLVSLARPRHSLVRARSETKRRMSANLTT
jgi:hypothetical protein